MDAPDIVFVGLEEYCDRDPRLQHENIRRRCTEPAYDGTRVDKNDAFDALAGLVKTDVPVWDVMAKIMASLTARPWETEREALGSRPARHRPTTSRLAARADATTGADREALFAEISATVANHPRTGAVRAALRALIVGD